MKIAALVDSPQHVCCRYRLAAFRPFLEAAGHTLDLISYPSSLWGRWRLPTQLKPYDAVVIQRRLLSRWQLARLRRSVRYLLFDYDDAVYFRDSYHPRGLHDPRRLRCFAILARSVDAILAGNDFLADEARRHGAARVHVIPTCVDPARYPIAGHHPSRGVELVWIGSSSTLHGLKTIAPMLEQIGKACPGVRLKLVCDAFFRLEHLSIIDCPWSEAGEARALASADIGLAWVPDDDWSRGKCGLKVLQYMAAGLPVVANPVGVQASMVRPGVNGFLAETPDQWIEAIRRLAMDAELRRRMGQVARRVLETEYSVAVGAALWNRALGDLQKGHAWRMSS